MKKVTLIIFSIIILLNLIFLFQKKEDYSELENRYLENVPKFTISSLFNGSYTKELELYLKDHFPFRELFVRLNTKVNKLELKKEINGVYLSKDNYLIEKYNVNDKKDKIVNVLNDFYSKLNYVNMEFMLVPTSITVNSELLPNFVSSQELEDINYINERLKFHAIKLYETLNKYNNDYQMFYRTDHHFTSYAAYYTYVEYCKSNNIKYYSINDFNIKEVSNDFYGTIYSKVIDNVKSDTLYKFSLPNESYKLEIDNKIYNSLYFDEYLEQKDKYSYYLGGNRAITTITNNNVNKGNILIIKDSYANTFIPFLANHFNQTFVIDPRYYQDTISDFVKNNNIKDIIIMYNANTISNDTGVLKIK